VAGNNGVIWERLSRRDLSPPEGQQMEKTVSKRNEMKIAMG